LEIVILDKQSDKLIRMEVQPKHTIGSIIETIVDKQKMDRSHRYILGVGNRWFGREQYLVKLKDAGIGDGEHLFLDAEIKPENASKPAFEKPKAEIAPSPDRAKAVVAPVPMAEKAKAEEVSVARPEVLPPPKFCHFCGKPLRANAKFCLSCGAAVRKR
jgi:hypothetical protein